MAQCRYAMQRFRLRGRVNARDVPANIFSQSWFGHHDRQAALLPKCLRQDLANEFLHRFRTVRNGSTAQTMLQSIGETRYKE